MCYCRPEIRTMFCANCAPKMYSEIIRLTALLAERDAEIGELRQIAAVHKCVMDNTHIAEDERIEKIAQLTTENAALREEVERLKYANDYYHSEYIHKSEHDEAVIKLSQEVERMKLIISGKTFVDERKLVAQEIIQYIIDQGIVSIGVMHDPVYEVYDSDIDELRQRYGLEG